MVFDKKRREPIGQIFYKSTICRVTNFWKQYMAAVVLAVVFLTVLTVIRD